MQRLAATSLITQPAPVRARIGTTGDVVAAGAVGWGQIGFIVKARQFAAVYITRPLLVRDNVVSGPRTIMATQMTDVGAGEDVGSGSAVTGRSHA